MVAMDSLEYLRAMSTYVVGDIQGCYKPLKQLLKKVKFNPEKDQLWCVGDLVNRGPDSLKTLRFLKSLGEACVCVLGNHDLHLLEYASGGQHYRRDTLEEVLAAPDLEELIHWLRHRPLMHHDKKLGWAMVHAGLHPAWSLKKARKRARLVEKALRSDSWQEFSHQLHHIKFPLCEPVKGDPARALFNAAVFTRIRFCTQDGLFNWDVRNGESSAANDYPWFAHKKLAWRDDCRVVYGHWASRGLVADQQHVLGLDSGCVWGGSMTMAKLKSGGRMEIVVQQACVVASNT
jgi:bis(5'-nucleosyl)-tetraphosphatase (symmetrical)